ncbi:MAG: PAS domain S-box protein [Steroidobacteraceae bacterium]|nr:PAS domain S-box protein [Steroidobacteraceae bacterium]
MPLLTSAMDRIERHPWVAYLLALALVGATALIRAALLPWLGKDAPLLPFLLPVAFAAYLGGRGPTAFAAFASAVTAHIAHQANPSPDYDPVSWSVQLALFAAVSMGCAQIIHRLRRARSALRESVEIARRAQREAQASEARFERLADHAPVLVWRVNAEQRATWFNRPWLDFAGRGLEAERGDGWTERLHPEDAERVLRLSRIQMERRVPFELEFRMRRYDGAYRWLLNRGVPVFEEPGRSFSGYIGSCIDITERKQAEQSSAELAAIVESAYEGVVGCTLDGVITSWNKGAQRIFGYSAWDVVGKPVTMLVPPDQRSIADQVFERIRHRQSGTSLEAVAITHDGRPIHVLLGFAPVANHKGEVISAAFTVHDITDRKRAEDALRAADRTKDIFLATLSHELRNPLAPIRQAARILKSERAGPDDVKRARDIIDRQARHMSRLLDDLLDISRITRGNLELRKETVNLATALDEALEIVRPLIEARGHTVNVDMLPQALPVDADPVRLAQILANLLTNAAKYTQDGGTIVIHVRAEGSQVVVRVIDNGVGISEDALPRIFEMFSQGRTERQYAEGGLGIGLALVRGLVTLHGGTVEARSAGRGLGSEFIVRLPLAEHVSNLAPSPAQLQPQRTLPRQILIADDNRDAADSLRILLESDGHHVHAVYNGQAALAAAEKLRPDIALLDIGMPELTGHEVAQRIRSHPWGANITLVALTGWGQTHDKQRSATAGFDHHVTKPMDPDRLRELIASLPSRAACG